MFEIVRYDIFKINFSLEKYIKKIYFLILAHQKFQKTLKKQFNAF
jgi:hypothetical protein